MKAYPMVRRVALLTVLTYASIAPAPDAVGAATAQRHSPHLTHRQLAALLVKARSPSDHERLADYYRSEARRLQSEAKRHERFARAFGDNTAPDNPDHFNVSRTARHCYNVAKDYLKEAREASAQAAHQEQLSQQVRKWPQ